MKLKAIWFVVLVSLPLAAQAQFGVMINQSHTLTITNYTGPGGFVAIPPIYNGVLVTAIGKNAFYDSATVTVVTIPGTVTSIGESAFYGCGNLTGVTLPASVHSIGDYAFADCTNLGSVLFKGPPPGASTNVFASDTNATVFYLPHVVGWTNTFDGLPAYLYAPKDISAFSTPPSADAVITGRGTHYKGLTASLFASTTNDCYYFEYWKLAGEVVSTSNPYTYTVSNSETFVAEFGRYQYAIAATSGSPAGWGTVTGGGNYACGNTVELSATAKNGFAFTDWTSSPDNVETNAHFSLKAIGDENWVAHFRDIAPPTLKITAPTNGVPVPSAAFVIEGEASDNVAVEAVYFNLNDAGWVMASNANNYYPWYYYVTLTPNSTNTLSAYAVDTSGNHSLTNGPIHFYCSAPGYAPMSVAGQLATISNGPAASNTAYVNYNSAVCVQWSAFTNIQSAVETYTYTPTGPNTAELVTTQVFPPTEAPAAPALELTFTNAYEATYTSLPSYSGTFQIEATQPSVPASLNGTSIIETRFTDSNYISTNTFASLTLLSKDNEGGDVTGNYTFTAFGAVDGLVVQSLNNGTTNYVFLTFTEGAAPPSGDYSSTTFSEAGQIDADSGTFTMEASGGAVSNYAGPPTLAGLQATVIPTNAPAYTRTFGAGTFASISPTNIIYNDVGIVLGNTRVSTNTGVTAFTAIAPPYAVGEDDETLDITWSKTGTSGTFKVANSGKTGILTNLVKVENLAAAALSGQTITVAPAGTGEKTTNVFTYNNFTSSGGVTESGTYTYAPYTPTMALVHFSPTNSTSVGKDSYLLLNYETVSGGAFGFSVPNTNSPETWRLEPGTFTMKAQ